VTFDKTFVQSLVCLTVWALLPALWHSLVAVNSTVNCQSFWQTHAACQFNWIQVHSTLH